MSKTFERVGIAFMLVVSLWVMWNLYMQTINSIIQANQRAAACEQRRTP